MLDTEAQLVKDMYHLGIEGLKVYNESGPSETTVQTTCHEAPLRCSADPSQWVTEIDAPCQPST